MSKHAVRAKNRYSSLFAAERRTTIGAPWAQPGRSCYNDRVEDQHSAHTADELVEAYVASGFGEHRFLEGAAAMLDGVNAFWDGLDADRLAGRTAA